MKCIKCDCESPTEVCEICRVELVRSSETPEQAQYRITQGQAEQARELMGEVVRLVAGKHPNISLNALGTAAGVIIGQIDHPAMRKRVHEKFEALVSEQSKLYTSKNIQRQFKEREAQLKENGQ